MATGINDSCQLQGAVVFYPSPVRPFLGSVRSCAFSVRDEAAFEEDDGIRTLIEDLDLMRGRRPEDRKSLFCIVRDMEPSAPLVIARKAGLDLLDDQSELARIDDSRGWIAALQRHLDPGHALVVQEYLNPDATRKDLFWVILPEAAACGIHPAEPARMQQANHEFLRESGAAE
jgi:hypothetical protein